MLIKPVMAVGCFMVSPGWPDQQAALTQDGKQAVPPDMQRHVGLRVEDVVQLTGAQAGLLHPQGLYRLSDAAGLLRLTLFALTSLYQA